MIPAKAPPTKCRLVPPGKGQFNIWVAKMPAAKTDTNERRSAFLADLILLRAMLPYARNAI